MTPVTIFFFIIRIFTFKKIDYFIFLFKLKTSPLKIEQKNE